MSDAVEEKLAQLDDLDDDVEDPNVLLHRGADGRPVVARVGGDLRMMSDRVVYAREIDVEDVSVAWDRHGEPEIVPFSTQSDRVRRADFREVADLD